MGHFLDSKPHCTARAPQSGARASHPDIYTPDFPPHANHMIFSKRSRLSWRLTRRRRQQQQQHHQQQQQQHLLAKANRSDLEIEPASKASSASLHSDQLLPPSYLESIQDAPKYEIQYDIQLPKIAAVQVALDFGDHKHVQLGAPRDGPGELCGDRGRPRKIQYRSQLNDLVTRNENASPTRVCRRRRRRPGVSRTSVGLNYVAIHHNLVYAARLHRRFLAVVWCVVFAMVAYGVLSAMRAQ